MGCDSCGNKYEDGIHPGCKNNGACGNMLDVHDWLANVYFDDEEAVAERVEIRFKATRKEIYQNPYRVNLENGDLVVVESDVGHDVGEVTMKGELVKLQMKRKGIKQDDELPKILRKPSEKDMEAYRTAKGREMPTMFETRRFAKELGLVMKVSDVEFQGDNRKATFYYTADGRVDYRELIKILGREFKVKVEMKQIGLRQEAGRIGGIGDCGRELCCSTWLTEFNAVPTVAAKYQNLFLNPLKLSGQCGRLKCCLNYELETYLEALEDFPEEHTKLETQKGTAKIFKMDILKRVLWFVYEDDQTNNQTYQLPVEKVNEIIEMNKKGEKPLDLTDFTIKEEVSEAEEEVHAFQDAVGEDSVTRFDRKKGDKKGKQRSKNQQQRGKKQGGQKKTDQQKEQKDQKSRPKPQGNQQQNKKQKPKNTGRKPDGSKNQQKGNQNNKNGKSNKDQ